MNYGKILKLTFDGKVYNISLQEKTRLRLVNAYGEYIYPVNVTQGAKDNEVYLHFNNINNLVFPAQLECLQTIAMGSEYVSFGVFTVDLFLDHLCPVPGDTEYLALISVEVLGKIAVAFDGKMYLEDYLALSSVSVAGSSVMLSFYNRYIYDGYLALSSVSVAGQYCDINGNPL